MWHNTVKDGQFQYDTVYCAVIEKVKRIFIMLFINIELDHELYIYSIYKYIYIYTYIIYIGCVCNETDWGTMEPYYPAYLRMIVNRTEEVSTRYIDIRLTCVWLLCLNHDVWLEKITLFRIDCSRYFPLPIHQQYYVTSRYLDQSPEIILLPTNWVDIYISSYLYMSPNPDTLYIIPFLALRPTAIDISRVYCTWIFKWT